MDERKKGSRLRRLCIGLGGGLVLLVGIVAIPYPGPGWVIVFIGLGILATEFDWAQAALDYTKEKYDDWQAWLSRQPLSVKVLFWLLTTLVVVTTIWLLNGYGLIDTWLNLHQDWVHSPLFK